MKYNPETMKVEMSKRERVAINALRRAEKGAFSRVAAYIVQKDSENWGTIRVAYPRDGAGRVNVFFWDTQGGGIQHASAGGYGYDKVQSCLEGMTWDGQEFPYDKEWRSWLRDRGYSVIQAV